MTDRRKSLLTALIELTTAAITLAILHPDITRLARPWALWHTHQAALRLGRTYGAAGLAAEVTGHHAQADTAYRAARICTTMAIMAETRYRTGR
jgi:hypothetical protein